MSISTTIEVFLSRHQATYNILSHPATESLVQAARSLQVPAASVARAVLLDDGRGVIMAVVPLTHLLDFEALRQHTGRSWRVVPADSQGFRFPDCEPNCIPPLGRAYDIETWYDEALFQLPQVIFEAGSHSSLISVAQDDFARLTRDARRVRIGSAETELQADLNVPAGAEDAMRVQKFTPAQVMKDRLEAIYELPLMPMHAQRIVQIRSNPKATAQELAEVVQADPSLAAQVLRYARSPLFGYRGNVDTVQDAITRVLGFDMVISLALGLAALKPFRNPPDGPLGLRAFWEHATYSAALASRLVKQLPREQRPKTGQAYLAGLLHNFGYLLLGHLFQPEFYLLNKMVAANPNVPIAVLERQLLGMGQAKQVLGMGHAETGALLMEHWDMPEDIVITVREHHNPSYRGPQAIMANLMYLVDILLKRRAIGDAETTELPAELLSVWGLEEAALEAAAEQLLENCANLDMTELLVA